MNCLVCHNPIRITRFQELFAIVEPMLCARCQSQLKKRSSEILYERNVWLESVIERLHQGDICLNQIFFHDLKRTILGYLNGISEIMVLESDIPMPYPWLEILVAEIERTIPKTAFKGEKTLVITEVNLPNDGLMVSIV